MAESQGVIAGSKPRLLDQVRDKIRVKYYSLRTEQAYLYWIKRFILFHGKRHPAEMGEMHVSAFLSRLAVADKVAASTQNQALSALLFLYREVLDRKLAWMEDMQRAKRPARVPVVLTHGEVESLLSRLHGAKLLMASLLYGSGLRLLECLRLRVKDIDFANRGSRRQGRSRPRHHASGYSDRTAAPSSGARARVAPA